MNSYLKMSEAVLSKSRQPLTAREILDAAYRLQLVPDHLFGKTQHKTLHARLCEDILHNRRASLFARTAPGRFSLASRLEAGGNKSEYVAPQRSYQLKQFDVLCADREGLDSALQGVTGLVEFTSIAQQFRRQVPLRIAEKDLRLVHLRLLVMICSNSGLLTLAAMDGAEFGSGRAIGLLGFLRGSDTDLFSDEPYGIDSAARRTIAEQSSVSVRRIHELTSRHPARTLRCIRVADAYSRNNSVVLLAQYRCEKPDEFIRFFPASRAPRWMRVPAEINDISTLERVSSRFIELAGNGGVAIA
ncbi:winged helix-turn-helix domain-containing protein [Mesorhizobium sp. CA6]|uniref:HTH domain-containing protein n=1 Tax=Mesorhizobium sp. CA6 TaxID=588500 RepID=UPI001CC919F8|nr:HTH domain-containing protein [Mesorhizobium sp. CA6]MBZ9766555.1 winged helix-turn-helix domain-containing protein [Mesorhizobium sp. CA6]